MDDLDKIKKFKDDIDNIEVPAEIDFSIEKGLKKKEKKDKTRSLSLYFAAAAALIIIVLRIPFLQTRIGSFYFQKTTKVDSRGIAAVGSYKNLKSILENYKGNISPKLSIDYSKKNGSVSSTSNALKNSANDKTSQSISHSSTNVQVNGVDEPDLVKNDGKYIYTLNSKENKISIVNAYPAQTMKLESSISIDSNFHASNMFLKGNFLVVFGGYYRNSYGDDDNIKDNWYSWENSKILVYDISNKSKPKLVKSLIVSGSYKDSRLIGDKVYVISNQNINIDFKNTSKEESDPFYIDSSLKGKAKEVDYKDIVYNPKDIYPNYVNISSIDLSNINSEAKVTSVLGNGEDIYCSGGNMYIASQSGSSKTTVYKFQLLKGKVELQTKTEVDGNILNQFSMDEYNGYLRVATTKDESDFINKGMSSAIYIFDKNLKLVSKISDIAKGERIYSTRFMGGRAYMVTFKQTDPLFAIDLSDPKKPKITGKLEMPGFSTYLQPYDGNHIIGFGRNSTDVSEGGVVMAKPGGMKFAMFDVTDISNPKQMYNVNLDDTFNQKNLPNIKSTVTPSYDVKDSFTESDVLYDHKALLFDKDKEIMAFPVFVNDGQNSRYYIYVYKVDLKNGFKLVYKAEADENSGTTCRAIYIGNTLYSIFDSKIAAVDMNSFKNIGELNF